MQKLMCTAKPDGIVTYYEDGRRTFTPFKEPLQLYRKSYEGRAIDYDRDKFTPLQNREYRIAIYGVAAIPERERVAMHPAQIRRARKTFLKAQAEINRMKNEALEDIVSLMFKHCKILQERNECEYDEVKNSLDFTVLGITKDMIIKRLVEKRILRQDVFC